LQATIRSFAPRPSSSSVFATTRSRRSSALFVPYGKWALSPRYRKSSAGSETRHSWSTVSPPTPESNMAIGSERSGVIAPDYRTVDR